MATPQLLAGGRLDYLVYDYLAEVTMSLLARARARNAAAGYATDFVTVAMQPNLTEIARQGIKVITNAGGVNPDACAAALRVLIKAQNLRLKVAVVHGDDLSQRATELARSGTREMYSGADFPALERIASINAYLGAFPIAAALSHGADIVVTGRCVDSAVTLGACIHALGWQSMDYDLLAAGSLAGHILECGTQATGGNFTDWETVVDTMAVAGYPIVEVAADGSFVCTKAPGTGGIVNRGTVAEQMLYEIGDPRAYLLPDVACDFSAVRLQQVGPDRVLVNGARGEPATATYKVSATFADGFRGGEMWTVYGRDADRKARKIADIALARARRALREQGLADFSETSVEIIGAETHYGTARVEREYREVQLKIAARHPVQAGIATLFKEVVGTALAAPPGLTGFAGGRPQPSPVVRLFSFLLPKAEIAIRIEVEGTAVTLAASNAAPSAPAVPSLPMLDMTSTAAPTPTPTPTPTPAPTRAPTPPLPSSATSTATLTSVPLERLAWARSGDKGDKANIGVIARRAEYMPYIWAALTEEHVAARFAHFLQGQVERFFLPGLPAMNFLLHDVLGGGGIASLRCDPQGKGYAQLLLCERIDIPSELLETGE
jgi:hypothetical protein